MDLLTTLTFMNILVSEDLVTGDDQGNCIKIQKFSLSLPFFSGAYVCVHVHVYMGIVEWMGDLGFYCYE